MDELSRSIGELHAKVDLLLNRETDNGKRVGRLEKVSWTQGGLWAALVLVFGPRLYPLLYSLPH